MPVVFACRGPLAGRRVEIPDQDLDAATASNGWALRLDREGVVLFVDLSTPADPDWLIPGVTTQRGRPIQQRPPVKTFVHPPAAEKRSHKKK